LRREAHKAKSLEGWVQEQFAPAKEAHQNVTAIANLLFTICSVNIHSLEPLYNRIYTRTVQVADSQLEFLAPTGFERDEDKSNASLIKHGIDFEDASEVFYGPVILKD
jgi:hypothetical protein